MDGMPGCHAREAAIAPNPCKDVVVIHRLATTEGQTRKTGDDTRKAFARNFSSSSLGVVSLVIRMIIKIPRRFCFFATLLVLVDCRKHSSCFCGARRLLLLLQTTSISTAKDIIYDVSHCPPTTCCRRWLRLLHLQLEKRFVFRRLLVYEKNNTSRGL